MENSPFSRSRTAQLAAKCVIDAGSANGLLDSPVAVAPEFAGAEKELIVKILAKLQEHLQNSGGTIHPDEISSLFHFVFAKSAETVTNFANHRPNDFALTGMLDGKIPVAAEELLTVDFKKSLFPRAAAQNFWDLLHSPDAPAPEEALLAFAEALKWCFRLGCHRAVEILESNNYRFV